MPQHDVLSFILLGVGGHSCHSMPNYTKKEMKKKEKKNLIHVPPFPSLSWVQLILVSSFHTLILFILCYSFSLGEQKKEMKLCNILCTFGESLQTICMICMIAFCV
ncbi:hypothetical protein AMTRI_Chr01g111520 [Amborella trichopoda]